MAWHKHTKLQGQHAVLSPSTYTWINYTPEKLEQFWRSQKAKVQGTKDHEFASLCINRKQKLPEKPATTLSLFVNDAIGFGMQSEQTLVYSRNIFGTADAVSFYDNTLRVHDLKTGKTKPHIEQLIIYAALFCLEYDVDPDSIDIILRIYQSNDFKEWNVPGEDVMRFMLVIQKQDEIIERLRFEDGDDN